MTAKKYGVVPGARIKEADAQLLGETIARLSRKNRVATPEALLLEARGKSSPIHHLFNWDDQEAATKYRTDQARYYIQSITIQLVTPTESVETRAFQIVTRETGERGAVPAKEVFSTPLGDQVVSAALRELNSWRRRYGLYRKLAELSTVFEAVDKTLDRAKDAAE